MKPAHFAVYSADSSGNRRSGFATSTSKCAIRAGSKSYPGQTPLIFCTF